MFVFDRLGEGTYHVFSVDEVFVRKKSRFQEILICRLADFGKALFLDGSLQLAQADHEVYHRALVQPALEVVGEAEKALIIGGGDGAAAKTILSKRQVKITLVEIDEEVVQLSRRHLKEVNAEVFASPNLKVVYMDGKEFVEKTSEKYDIIIVDVTDPGASGLANTIYAASFFQTAGEHLKEGGVLVTQAGSAWFRKDSFRAIGKLIEEVFPTVVAYGEFVHSFGSLWGFYVSTRDKRRNIHRIVRELGYRVL